MKALQIAARVLAWSLIGFALALVLVIVRLNAGPLEIGWLKPRIERALTPERGAVAVSARGIELRLNKEQRTLELVGVDVRYRVDDQADTPAASVLAFPEVELALSIEALLNRGMIAASEITAKAPSLIITRSEGGVIGLFSEADYDDQADAIDFGAFLRRFTLAPEAGSRIAYLRKLRIGGARVAFYDRTRASALTAEDADLVLVRREGGVDGWLRADLLQKSSGPAALQLSGRHEPGAGHMTFEADVADFMPADLAALWPLRSPRIPAAVAGVRLPVRASIDGAIGLDGTISPMKIEAQAEGGDIDLPAYLAEPLAVSSALFEGTIGSDLGVIEIDQARIESRGATLSGSGDVVWRENEPELLLDLAVQDVRAQDLPAFWPRRLGVRARDWVLDNVKIGRVKDGNIRLDLKPGDWGPEALRDDALDGSFAFEDLSVRYVDGMPPLENASGTAVFDADRMDFDVLGGQNAGLTLRRGSVTITGMDKPGKLTTQLHVAAETEGSIEQALGVLDHPPLKVAKDLGIAPGETAGRVAARIDLRMPLHGDVTAEEAQISAEAELIDLAIRRLPKLESDVRLDQGAFTLVVDDDAVRLDGAAEVNDIPLAITVYEPFEDQASKRRIGLAGKISQQQLESLDIVVDGLEGEFGFEATVTETNRRFWVDFEADLQPLAIAPPGLVWRKPVGQAGVLHASIAMPIAKTTDGAIEVKQFDIDTGDLEASGSLLLSPSNDGLETLTFDVLRLADTDVEMRISPDANGGVDLVIEGERLDLDALFGDDPEIGDTFRSLRATLRTDQLRARGVELVDVEADAVHAPDGWRSASLIGALASGGKLTLELAPVDDVRRLELRSDNAGALIEALDLGRRVEGGDVLLSASVRSQDPMVAEGRLEIGSFTLRDAPLLARILTLASFTGIGNLLGGEGIQVDHLIMPFSLGDRKFTITDGLMRGSQLGLTFKGDVDLTSETLDIAGTIIPVYSLNRLIGQVPIIGRILTGVDGRGAFATTYSIKGPQGSPVVYVNPLSMLTPGLIRDLVGGLLNGTLEPPDVRETDD